MDGIAWELLLAAAAGGAIGATMGALQSFSIAGIAIIVGETYKLILYDSGGVASVDITLDIGLGPPFGPHVAFGGEAAEMAFIAAREDIDRTFPYHPAKEITRGLGARADALLVGAGFGIFGYLVAVISKEIGLPTDPVALAIVISGFAHRVVFGYSFIGASFRTVAQTILSRKPGAEPWLPYQRQWLDVFVLGFFVGTLGGYLAWLTGSAFLAFGISAFSVLFLCCGVDEFPITHHITLPASTAVVAAAGVDGGASAVTISTAVPLGSALVIGGVAGVIGSVLGEATQRIFYAHAETHFDPPAASIIGSTLLIAIAAWIGLLPGTAWIPTP